MKLQTSHPCSLFPVNVTRSWSKTWKRQQMGTEIIWINFSNSSSRRRSRLQPRHSLQFCHLGHGGEDCIGVSQFEMPILLSVFSFCLCVYIWILNEFKLSVYAWYGVSHWVLSFFLQLSELFLQRWYFILDPPQNALRNSSSLAVSLGDFGSYANEAKCDSTYDRS